MVFILNLNYIFSNLISSVSSLKPSIASSLAGMRALTPARLSSHFGSRAANHRDGSIEKEELRAARVFYWWLFYLLAALAMIVDTLPIT